MKIKSRLDWARPFKLKNPLQGTETFQTTIYGYLADSFKLKNPLQGTETITEYQPGGSARAFQIKESPEGD